MTQDQLTALAEGQLWAPLGGLLIGMLLSLSPVSLPGVAAALATFSPGRVATDGTRSHVPLRQSVPAVVAFVAGMDGVLALFGYLFAQVTIALTRASVALHVVAGGPARARRRTAGVRPRLALLTGQRDTPDARPGVHLRDALLSDRVPGMRPHRRGAQQRHRPARRASPRLACPRRLRPRAKSRACHRRQPRIPALADRSGPHLETTRPPRGAPLSRRWWLLPLSGPRWRRHHPASGRARQRPAARIALRWGRTGERPDVPACRRGSMSEPSIGTALATRLRTPVASPGKALGRGG